MNFHYSEPELEDWKNVHPDFTSELAQTWQSLGFFSTAETLTANNLVLIYINVTNPDCRIYLGRQIFEEVIHTDTFVYCCDSLGLDPDEIYNAYQSIPSIKEKDDFVIELTKSVLDPQFRAKIIELEQKKEQKEKILLRHQNNVKIFLRNLIGYYVIMEGIFFYAGFAMILKLRRSKKMVGIGQQFEYIMRDEKISELIKKAVELEKQYAIDACPPGIVGFNAHQFCEYVEYIANRRLERIGLPKEYFDKATGAEGGGSLNWDSEDEEIRKGKTK
ncbi:12909_t:CDS:2 [Entrophospora sp. SA101]|nr:12909_t:CDS:2 [Entrophospora sp. SA101]